MKNIFTGAWVFTICAIVFYFLFRYAAFPLVNFLDTVGRNDPIETPGIYLLSFVFTILMICVLLLLTLVFHKIGEAVNQR